MKYIMYSIMPINTDHKYAYIGHTVNFKSRKNSHKNACENTNDKCHNFQVYKIIREHNGFENWEMKPLEEYECDNKTQARIRERYWFDKYQTYGYNMCNDKRPYITEEEHKNHFAKDSEWYVKNIERARERRITINNEIIQLKDENEKLKAENEKLKALLNENNISFN